MSDNIIDEENSIEKPGKKLSSYRNISYSKRDIFYRKAKEEGFRARSVYKLKEIIIIFFPHHILTLLIFVLLLVAGHKCFEY